MSFCAVHLILVFQYPISFLGLLKYVIHWIPEYYFYSKIGPKHIPKISENSLPWKVASKLCTYRELWVSNKLNGAHVFHRKIAVPQHTLQIRNQSNLITVKLNNQSVRNLWFAKGNSQEECSLFTGARFISTANVLI